MRVSFNTIQGRTFLIGSTKFAAIDLPDLAPGTYDVVLFDYMQEVDRAAKGTDRAAACADSRRS